MFAVPYTERSHHTVNRVVVNVDVIADLQILDGTVGFVE